MDPALNTLADNAPRGDTLTILVGNSIRSNEHIAALKAIHQQFGDTVNVIVPMGYRSEKRRLLKRRTKTTDDYKRNRVTVAMTR